MDTGEMTDKGSVNQRAVLKPPCGDGGGALHSASNSAGDLSRAKPKDSPLGTGLIVHVRFGSKADICSAKRHVRFTPKSGHVQCTRYVRFSNRPVWVKRFQTSIAAVSMSLTGSCFSSESAPGPFHYGIRGRGGTI